MRVCFVAEGCYPYYVGGVSSWVNSMIRSFPNTEFVLLTIVANRDMRGKFVYELPENVSEVYEVYLDDVVWTEPNAKKDYRLTKEEYAALRSLILNLQVDWDTIFDMFQKRAFTVDSMLMGDDFFNAVSELYNKRYPEIVFSDFLWTMRSIYLPLFLVLQSEIPRADVYHCVATGYAGILGCMAKKLFGCGLLISEHGIYTREREEELIKATWVQNIYKSIWIEQFRRMSQATYDLADIVTSLFAHAQELQWELGCPPEKTRITPNGINADRLQNLPGKTEEDEKYVNVGAVLRVAPIKDVKTMIQAFYEAKHKVPELKLWIMGPTEDESTYAQECFELVDMLGVKDVVFTGRIDIRDYLGRMDFTILTSISEGQPLTILEGYAAHKPVVATDVGNCRGLIFGEGDDELGTAGILCHIMNVEEIAQAIAEMAFLPEKTKAMGEVGYQRVMSKYRVEHMRENYRSIYQELADKYGVEFNEER